MNDMRTEIKDERGGGEGGLYGNRKKPVQKYRELLQYARIEFTEGDGDIKKIRGKLGSPGTADADLSKGGTG